MATAVWFRRDLRLADNPAVLRALDLARSRHRPAHAVFVLDPALWGPAGQRRRTYLLASLDSLAEQIRGIGGDGVVLLRGDPAEALPRFCSAAGADVVLHAADFGPYGAARDERARRALAGIGVRMEAVSSPYGHSPGSVLKPDGSPYRVFTPFYRAWRSHPMPAPAPRPQQWPGSPFGSGALLPPSAAASAPGPAPAPDLPAGEPAALGRWAQFLDQHHDAYPQQRDRPDLAGTSRLSAALHFGEIHPRTIYAQASGDSAFVRQLVWRDFYAQVLAARPETARADYQSGLQGMAWRSPVSAAVDLDAWRAGRTGFPFVDAGMRQLQETGWMHNRLRMVVASFLVKDLHLHWRVGARWFMQHLVDADLASNQHGWQWAAGTGTDAAPYYRVFNPVAQGERFDPVGDYVRRWVPQLRHLSGAAAHRPWAHPQGYAHGYPQPILDHAAERLVALQMLAAADKPR